VQQKDWTMARSGSPRSLPSSDGSTRGWVLTGLVVALALAMFAATMPAQAAPGGQAPDPRTAGVGPGEELWDEVPGTPPTRRGPRRAVVVPDEFEAVTLDRTGLEDLLERAPRERMGRSTARAASAGLVVALPDPDGGFQRFELRESPIMEPALAAKHPDVATYSGRGIDDAAATIRASLTPLGFNASVRSPDGIWYIDPFYVGDDDVHISYFARDLAESPHGVFIEREDDDHDELEAQFGALGDLEMEVSSAGTTLLRTYRLAMLSDPSYATYFGAANVTAAKVTLLNRVNQIYEDETAIRMVLIADNDELNLDTPEQFVGANGPCGTAPCFTTINVSCTGATLTRNRIVIGQLVGASSYDVGHIILGRPGGGVASLNSVGGNAKAQGCTGLPNPVGDFFGVDYVAHEIGHQFGANHTFNGNQSNCSGGNRSALNSVEPGSGSSIMAYAGICGRDNLQPHTDPYWSQRSFQEITAFVTSDRPAINEVQNVSLYGFDTNGDRFRLAYAGGTSGPIVRGTNDTAAGIKAAIESSPNWPAGGVVTVANWGGGGAPSDNGFQVTFSGSLAQTDVALLQLVDTVGTSGFVGETAKGGPVDNQGHTITDTGNLPPVVDPLPSYTIPYRTPFELTGNATDPDGGTVTYLWEQNDRGLTAIPLVATNKTSGPLFRQFGTALDLTQYDPTVYNNPGVNAVTTDPTRVFPDLAQLLAGNTNARTGDCPGAPPPATGAIPPAMIDCYSEFLPTTVYPGPMNFRLTVRDGNPGAGGITSQDTAISLATGTGPFLVTSQEVTGTLEGDAPLEITWDVAGTDGPTIGTAQVQIALSTDGGFTYPHVLAAATPNDGTEGVLLPNVSTDQARIKVSAVGNVFFDVNLADQAIQAVPVVTNDAPAGVAEVQYSDALDPTVTVTATDLDSPGSSLTATVDGLPAGLSLEVASTIEGPPGTRTWTVEGNVTAAPGTYPVTVTVTDDTGFARSTSFDIVVLPEDARVTFTGAERAATTLPSSSSAAVVLSATVQDISVTADAAGDDAPGDIRNATVTFVDRSLPGAPAVDGCADLPVGLVDAADDTVGTAACVWTVDLGSADRLTADLGIVVGGFYLRDAAVDDVGVTIARAAAGSSVSGSGQLDLLAPAGLLAGDVASKVNASIGAQFNQGGRNLQSSINVIVRRTEDGVERTYQLRGQVASLAVSGAAATLGGTATLTEVTDDASPTLVAADALLLVEATDAGQPGRTDTLVVSAWDPAGGLWLSTNWDGVQPVEVPIVGGNLRVR
jgi:hypothetical protein